MSEWKPIETAPMNVLVFLYEPHSCGGFMFSGCFSATKEWRNNLDLQVQHPTHWMPLPEPPPC